MRTLLKQLLDTDHEAVNLSQWSDLLLSQADNVGTAVKCDGEESDPYAIISVLNLNQQQESEVVQQLVRYLKSRAQADPALTRILDLPTGSKVGLLVSERFINMPHQTVPPLYNMLQREMSLAGEAFAFTHILVLSKVYTEVESTLDVEDDRPQKKKHKAQSRSADEMFYFHPEDEVLEKHAITAVSYDFEKSADVGQSDSKRAFQDYGIKPQGRLILLEASKLDMAVKAIGEYLSTS